MFVTRDDADVAMEFSRGALDFADNDGFTGHRRIYALNGAATAEGACHRRLREAAAFGSFEFGRQQRQIIAVAPELGADQIEEFARTGLAFVAIHRPERPAMGRAIGMVRIIVFVGHASFAVVIRIHWEVAGFRRREIHEANTAFIAPLYTGIFGKGHKIGLATVLSLTRFTVAFAAAGDCARVTEHDFVVFFEFGHVIIRRDFECGFAGCPGIAVAFAFYGGDGGV